MFLAGLFVLAAGAWLLDSAVKNRNPITSLVSVIQNPGDARAVLKDQEGGAYLVDHSVDYSSPAQNPPTAASAAAGNTTGLDPNADNGVNGTTVTVNSAAVGAIAFARSKIGLPYVWGGTGGNNSKGGYDCSGLVGKAYSSVGISLPSGSRPTTATMLAGLASGKLQRVSRDDLKPGDLVFPNATHVGIYTGNNKFVEAPRAGKNVREVTVWGFFTAARVKPTTVAKSSSGGSGM